MSRDSEAFTHSRRLFVDSSGLPLTFFMRPGTERSRIKPLIEHGGGTISNSAVTNCIRLSVRGSIVIHPHTVASDYIDNCVRENRLLDVETFYVNPPAAKLEDSDSSIELPEQKDGASFRASRRGYTFSEQKKIVDYICNNNFHGIVKGNKLWKKMEKKKVVGRTWQSMKEHFKKIILRQLHLYPITKKDRQLMLSVFPNIEDQNLRLCGPETKKIKVEATTEEDMIVDSEESDDSEIKIPVSGTSATLHRLASKEQNLLLNLEDASSPHKTESLSCNQLTAKSPVVVLKHKDIVQHSSSIVISKYVLYNTEEVVIESDNTATEQMAVASEASPELFPCGNGAENELPSSAEDVPESDNSQTVELVGMLQEQFDRNAKASNESDVTSVELIEEIGKPTREDLQRLSRKQLLNYCVAKRGERNMLLSQMTKEHFATFLTNIKKRTMLEMLESEDISEDFDKLDLELNSFVSSTSEESDTDT